MRVFINFHLLEMGECEEYEWAVVGAGPCGTFSVASLLSHQAFLHTISNNGERESSRKRVCWIEANERHQMGRLSNYPFVPGNTVVGLLTQVCKKSE